MRRRCTAQRKNGRGPCNGHAVRGSTKCRMHGGTSPGGPIKHGLYSKRLGPLREAFQEFLANPRILDVAPQLAAMDTITEELLGRALDGDCPGFRKQAWTVFRELQDAAAAGDKAAMHQHTATLSSLLRDGWARDRALANAVGVIEKRAARAQRQQSLALKGQEVLTRAAVLAAFHRIATIIRDGAPPRLASDLIGQINRELLVGGGQEGPTEAAASDVA